MRVCCLLVIFSFSIYQNFVKSNETNRERVKLDVVKIKKTFAEVNRDVKSVDGGLKKIVNEIVNSKNTADTTIKKKILEDNYFRNHLANEKNPSTSETTPLLGNKHLKKDYTLLNKKPSNQIDQSKIQKIIKDTNNILNEIVELAEKNDKYKLILDAAIQTKAAFTDLYQAKDIKGHSVFLNIDTYNIKETDDQFRKAQDELRKAVTSNQKISGLASKLIETINTQLNLELPKLKLTKECRYYKMLSLHYLDLKNLSQTLAEINKITERKSDDIGKEMINSLLCKLKELIEENSSNKLLLGKIDHTMENKIRKHIEDLENCLIGL